MEPVVKVTRTVISAASAARVGKLNGASKIGKIAATAMALEAEKFLAALTKKAVAAAIHAGRRVIREEDILFAMKE